jgi:hypothetical protein
MACLVCVGGSVAAPSDPPKPRPNFVFVLVDDMRIDGLYDLERDPFEMRNRIRDPAAQEELARLRNCMKLLQPQTRPAEE